MIKIFVSKSFLVFLLLGSVLISGCKKAEGTGGAATIEGKIVTQEYNSSGVIKGAPHDGYNTKVYLIYGTGSAYDDIYSTSYDGSYKFENLRSGSYTLFVYSNIIPVPSNPPYQEAVKQTITITDKKGIVTAAQMSVNS